MSCAKLILGAALMLAVGGCRQVAGLDEDRTIDACGALAGGATVCGTCLETACLRSGVRVCCRRPLLGMAGLRRGLRRGRSAVPRCVRGGQR